MNTLSHQAQAVIDMAALYLLEPEGQSDMQHYRQLWQTAQLQGDRQTLQSLRQQVVIAGRELQQRQRTHQNRMLWLDLLSLRCSMVSPRMRF